MEQNLLCRIRMETEKPGFPAGQTAHRPKDQFFILRAIWEDGWALAAGKTSALPCFAASGERLSD
jgi:hypothetical protein